MVGELLPPIPACPWQEQQQLVSLPPAAAEISVNQSYRVELSQSQRKALAQIHQLKMSKAFEPDWNLSKTNKQTKILPQILVVFLFDFRKIVRCICIYFPDFYLLFLHAWWYKPIPIPMYILDFSVSAGKRSFLWCFHSDNQGQSSCGSARSNTTGRAVSAGDTTEYRIHSIF